jgi:site-specific DNA recombinase
MNRPARKLRCAVYTRKSSEEGLEQEFNSLAAQRSSCEAYIASQRSEGWVPLPNRYDDGGYSGGNMDRPGLKALLADIEEGLVDVVVVYKIDRLSRALMDFSRLVDLFDRTSVTFVSVTQSFNTTTSMGRLTLNILLSFAQFEREITGERIRDKITASRKRGIWMGGIPSLGYDVSNRKLVINEAEAALVRKIFQRFAQIGSLTHLVRELAAEGVVTKTWRTIDGKWRQGRAMDKGFLYKLLHNRVYLGDAVHKGIAHAGEHKAIISKPDWDAVQAIFAINGSLRAKNSRRRTPSLLRGLVFGPDGYAMTPSMTRKDSKVYRYYVSTRTIKDGADGVSVRRVAAGVLENAVVEKLKTVLRAPETVVATWNAISAQNQKVSEDDVRIALQNFVPTWDELFTDEQARIVQLLVERVDIRRDEIDVRIRTEGIASIVKDRQFLAPRSEAA